MQRVVGEIFSKSTCFVGFLRQLDLLVFREDNSDRFIMKNATVQVGQGLIKQALMTYRSILSPTSVSLMAVGHLKQSVVFFIVKDFHS